MNGSPLGTGIERHTSVYRALLRLYPAGFRREFGADMVQVFGDRLRYGGPAGPLSSLAVWTNTLVDLAVTAARLRMEALMNARSDHVPLVVALFLLAACSVVAVGVGGIFAGAPLAVLALAGIALYRSDVAKLLRRPAEPAASSLSVPRRLFGQAWWAPLATALAVVEIGLTPYFALFGDLDLAGVLIGGTVSTALGVMVLVGLLRRPDNRPLGHTLVLVGSVLGFTGWWMVWPPVLAGLVWVGVLSSAVADLRKPPALAS